MNRAFSVGVFSPNDPGPWVRSDNPDKTLTFERHPVDALRGRGMDLARGGEGPPREDQVAWSTKPVQDPYHGLHTKAVQPRA